MPTPMRRTRRKALIKSVRLAQSEVDELSRLRPRLSEEPNWHMLDVIALAAIAVILSILGAWAIRHEPLGWRHKSPRVHIAKPLTD